MAVQTEPGFVLVIHPGLGEDSVSEAPESSLPQLYLAGWTLLAEPPDEPPPPEPPAPVTRDQVAGTPRPAPAKPAAPAAGEPAKE
jgi:hypothetical protein